MLLEYFFFGGGNSPKTECNNGAQGALKCAAVVLKMEVRHKREYNGIGRDERCGMQKRAAQNCVWERRVCGASVSGASVSAEGFSIVRCHFYTRE